MQQNSNSYNQFKNEFYEKYHNVIVPLRAKFENERSQMRFIVYVCWIISSLIMLKIFFYFWGVGIAETPSIFILSVFPIIIGKYIIDQIQLFFEKKLKTKIMPTVCECFGNMIWEFGKYAESYKFRKSLVVPYFKDYKYNDVFYCNYKNINFEIVEGEFLPNSFKGVVIRIDLNNKYKSHTVVLPNTFGHNAVPLGMGLTYTQLEDCEFEKKFDTYTTDEIEARLLLTPTFMEQINTMQTAFKAKNIRYAFWERRLYIALETKNDLFAIGKLNQNIKISKPYFEMFEEIASIVNLIEHFQVKAKE